MGSRGVVRRVMVRRIGLSRPAGPGLGLEHNVAQTEIIGFFGTGDDLWLRVSRRLAGRKPEKPNDFAHLAQVTLLVTRLTIRGTSRQVPGIAALLGTSRKLARQVCGIIGLSARTLELPEPSVRNHWTFARGAHGGARATTPLERASGP